MLVFVAIILVMLVAMVAFSVDVAYMHLVRTELHAATDAAAKAGASTLMREQSGSAAIAEAIAAGAANKVAGKSLQLASTDIELGQSILQADGSWAFTPALQPYRAVRVNPRMTTGSLNGSIPLFSRRSLA